MGNLSGLFGSVRDAFSIMLDPFLFWGYSEKISFNSFLPTLRLLARVFCFLGFFWELRMRLVGVCSQLQMCFRFCDPSAVVSAYAVTVGLVWYGLSTLIHVSFFIFIISPSYFYRVFSRLNVLILLFLTEHPGGVSALVAG